MKTRTIFKSVMAVFIFIFCCFGCSQKNKKAEAEVKIENTLLSVHLWTDSIGVAPSELLASIESTNKAIDSIGYPDAGYKLWLF